MPEERPVARQIDTVTGEIVTPMSEVDDYALPPEVAEQEAAGKAKSKTADDDD